MTIASSGPISLCRDTHWTRYTLCFLAHSSRNMAFLFGRAAETPATLAWLSFVAYSAAYWEDPLNTPPLPQSVIVLLLNEYLVLIGIDLGAKRAYTDELVLLSEDYDIINNDLQLIWAATRSGVITLLELEPETFGWPIRDDVRALLDYQVPGVWEIACS